jgi:mono/diheme cytochrome c family protein
MKKVLKFLKWTAILLLTIIAVLLIAVFTRYDRKFDAPYPEITASTDSAVLARGKYLVYGPAHCVHCHAPTSEIARIDQGEEVELSGGFDFVLPIGMIYAPNITPDPETGIGDLTDQQIARALRYGIKHDGAALLDFMPFYDLADEDLTAIISYLRTTKPVKNLRPENEYNFLGKAVKAFMIKPMGDGEVPLMPPQDSTIAYGKYLSESVANCRGCHTQRNMMDGSYVGPDYAGNQPFEVIDKQGKIISGKHIVTPNLTPDPETGRIANWNQEMFINRFRQGSVLPGSPMPWGAFMRMSDMELKALYKFLQSREPVKNAVQPGILEGDPPV